MVSLSFAPVERGEVLLELRHGYGRKKFDEEEEEKQEQAERSHGDTKLHPAGMVKTPIVWNEVLGHGTDDDHKALGIHADINEDRDGEEGPKASSNLLEEKEKRGYCIAEYHDPEHKRPMADGPEEESLSFKDIPAVPGHEIFDDVGITDDKPGEDGGLGDGLKVFEGDDLFEAKNTPQGDQ